MLMVLDCSNVFKNEIIKPDDQRSFVQSIAVSS